MSKRYTLTLRSGSELGIENMTDEIQQADKGTDEPVIEQGFETEGQAEPSTVEKVNDGYVETDNDRVQARINKLTAKNYAEKRRADDLQAKIDSMSVNVPEAKEPKIEDFDYDEQAHNSALIDYKVNKKALEIQKQQTVQIKENQAQESTQDLLDDFATRVVEHKKLNPGYDEAINNLPEFPAEIYTMLLKSDPGLIQNLGNNLDVAHELAGMDTMSAAMKIGQLSAQILAKPKQVKVSGAPDVINPISSNGATSSDDEMVGVTFS